MHAQSSRVSDPRSLVSHHHCQPPKCCELMYLMPSANPFSSIIQTSSQCPSSHVFCWWKGRRRQQRRLSCLDTPSLARPLLNADPGGKYVIPFPRAQLYSCFEELGFPVDAGLWAVNLIRSGLARAFHCHVTYRGPRDFPWNLGTIS